jgi:hypothetical protein
MCRFRSVVWSFLFLMGAAVPALCQVIVPPNIPGAAVPANIGTSAYQQTVYSTGTFDFTLLILKNGLPKYFTAATVCTSGPFTTITFDVPLGSFGLKAGDLLVFIFTVRHRGTEGNTTSTVTAFIPVIAPPQMPPTTTRAPRGSGDEFPRWARRERMLNG